MEENRENSAVLRDHVSSVEEIKSPLLYQLSYVLQYAVDSEVKTPTGDTADCLGSTTGSADRAGTVLTCCVCGKSFTRKQVRPEYAGRHCCSVACAGKLGHDACMESFTVPDSDKSLRTRAQGLVNKRLKLGWFDKPTHCCLCHQPHQKISAHHSDYSKPDRVHWLCAGCHLRVHHDPDLLIGIRAFICDRKNPAKPRHSKGGRRLPPELKKPRPPQITIKGHQIDGTDVIEILACGHTYRRPEDGKRHKQRKCVPCRDGSAIQVAA